LLQKGSVQKDLLEDQQIGRFFRFANHLLFFIVCWDLNYNICSSGNRQYNIDGWLSWIFAFHDFCFSENFLLQMFSHLEGCGRKYQTSKRKTKHFKK
jgi:hypothetical protein